MAADLILECKSWESKLKSSETLESQTFDYFEYDQTNPKTPRPDDLIAALVRDMNTHLQGLEEARGNVEVGGPTSLLGLSRFWSISF